MKFNPVANPKALLLFLLLALCCIQGNHALPTSAGEEPGSPVAPLLVRRRRQDPPDPPIPVPPIPDPQVRVPNIRDPDVPSTDTATLRVPGGPFRFINPSAFRFNPFSFSNPFAGPPRGFGRPYYGRRGSYYRSDPISSFFGGVESFKRDLVNFFFG
ncbi:uncharacterized protein LOC124155000 [Ischnura elegans]|uniref:uncharacterized protein LOC124155000 n=1 Tax=Ischnura elegans TaxID=197161 RepID=UPI001ED86B4E|nr:uncharacterized protein LOC124155000 [Ischnura elegans]